MTPSAEPASCVCGADAVAVEELLQDGEVVILAIKPSPWFLLLVSRAALVLAGVLAGGAALAREAWGMSLPLNGILLLAAGIALGRVFLACLQWLGRLYILTNRRVLLLRGIARSDVRHERLRDVRRAIQTAGFAERPLGLGTLAFETTEGRVSPVVWLHLASVRDVREEVERALRQAR